MVYINILSYNKEENSVGFIFCRENCFELSIEVKVEEKEQVEEVTGSYL